MIRQFPAPAALAAQLTGAGPGAGGDPAGPALLRDAATVMLVRDGADGVEVFLFRRVRSMVFAAGMHVFPGGRTDAADADPAVPWEGPDPAVLGAALGAPPDAARALAVTAVRETFEECGVLLASPPGGGPVVGLPGGWDDARRALLDGSTTLPDLLRDNGLVLRADRFAAWARWVTPPGEVRRYDTRFFLVPMPPEQTAHDLGGEGERAEWVPAREAVRRWRTGEAAMLPPTIVCCEDLAAAPDVAALQATPRAISPVMPWAVRAADGGVVVQVVLDGRGGGAYGDPAHGATGPDATDFSGVRP
ncbi:NUDIX hydrolase [Kineosporia sp. R_H_3]|uniref:NUDIX hydrolase n=1 Tax=Kineosporia sp. R_H_3 TaxID=1961848 RepID=UPI0018E96595|nr:NUDIX hydrolase [Kineosporia sp. R_H_3]